MVYYGSQNFLLLLFYFESDKELLRVLLVIMKYFWIFLLVGFVICYITLIAAPYVEGGQIIEKFIDETYLASVFV